MGLMLDRLSEKPIAAVLVRVALPIGVFALVTALALVLGAEGVGVAGTFGILAFAVATLVVLLTDPPPPSSSSSRDD